jgi:hypothetical protein
MIGQASRKAPCTGGVAIFARAFVFSCGKHEVRHYRPYYSINAKSWWLHKAAADVPVGGAPKRP